MEKTIISLMLMALMAGVFGGCNDAQVTDDEFLNGGGDIVVPEENSTEDDVKVSVYKNGEYNVKGSYQSPAGPEKIEVKFTLENDVIKGLEVTPLADNQTSSFMQKAFKDGVNAIVVGKRLDELGELSAVNGSSLTPQGFNDAVDQLKEQAQV